MKDVTGAFVSKLVNESKDLEGEIVDMVNKHFWDLIEYSSVCNTCNGAKQITGTKEDGLTYGYLCPNCK